MNDYWRCQTTQLHGVYLASLYSQLNVGRAGIRAESCWFRILAKAILFLFCLPLSHDSCRQPQAYIKPEAAITVFELLMISGVPLETCWVIKKHRNNKFYYTVASCWLFPRGIRFVPICSHKALVLSVFPISTEFQPRGTFFHRESGCSRFPRNFDTLVANQMFISSSHSWNINIFDV
jgi:hypothetical protein